MAKGDRWTTPFGGREIHFDGKHVITVTKKDFSPTETDALAHFIVELLNDAEDDGDYFEGVYKEYMRGDDEPDDDDELDEEEENG